MWITFFLCFNRFIFSCNVKYLDLYCLLCAGWRLPFQSYRRRLKLFIKRKYETQTFWSSSNTTIRMIFLITRFFCSVQFPKNIEIIYHRHWNGHVIARKALVNDLTALVRWAYVSVVIDAFSVSLLLQFWLFSSVFRMFAAMYVRGRIHTNLYYFILFYFIIWKN